jgi:hypothetical protein
MSTPTTGEFLLRFPEFGEQSLSVVEGALAEASRSVTPAVWGYAHTDAVSYLAAHLLATRTMQIGAQVGATSGTPTGTQLESTLYGQEHKRLREQLPLSGFVF